MYVDKKSLVLRGTQREDEGVYHCVMVPSFTSGTASNAITTDTHLGTNYTNSIFQHRYKVYATSMLTIWTSGNSNK